MENPTDKDKEPLPQGVSPEMGGLENADMVENSNLVRLYEKAKNDLLMAEQELGKTYDRGREFYLEQEVRENKKIIKYLAPHVGIPDRESWRGKDPFVFRESNVKELKKLLEKWHTIKPDYIFLTETSAVPYGYAIREAWRAAYPKEKPPRFYRIESWTQHDNIIEIEPGDDIDDVIENLSADDPKRLMLNKMREGMADYLEDRIKKDEARVIIFDQYDKSMWPRRLSGGTDGGRTISGLARELYKFCPRAELYYAGVNNIDGSDPDKLNFGRSGYPVEKKHPRVTLKRNVNHEKKQHGLSMPGNRIDPLSKESPEEITQEIFDKGYKLVGRTIKDPERRKEALQYIGDLKEVGKLAGRELHDKLEKSK